MKPRGRTRGLVRAARVPPGNRFEGLREDRVRSFSIRFNDQWRPCFCFEQGNAYDAEIVDCH